MRLTTHTDYALRMLMHLAAHPGRTVTVAEVAGRFGISRNHLTKVAQSLSALGAVATERGRGGGLKLASPPADINLGALVRALEAQSALVECFPGGAGTCRIDNCCRLKSVLKKAQDAFFGILDDHSLDDLIRSNEPLRVILQGEAA